MLDLGLEDLWRSARLQSVLPRRSGGWLACLNHLIQPLPGLNAIDFVKRVFRQRRDVEILLRTNSSFWVW